jgi:hypothetical protein
MGFILGAIRGSLLEILAIRYNLMQTTNPLNSILVRTINSAILSGITVPLIALALETADNFKIQKRELIEQLGFIRARNQHISNLDTTIENLKPEQLRSQVNGLLAKSRSEFEAELAKESANPQTLVDILNNAAENIIRPLSHILYNKSRINVPNMGILQSLRLLSNNVQIEIPVILIAYNVFGFKNLFVLHGLKKTLMLLTSRTLLFSVSLYIFKNLLARFRCKTPYAFFLAAIGSVSLFTFLDSSSTTWFGTQTDSAKILLSATWNLITILVAGFLLALSDVNRFQLDTLKMQIKEEDLAAHTKALEERMLYKTYSKILHGIYHSRLVACAISIKTTAKDEDKTDFHFEINRARGLLNLDFAEHNVDLVSDFETLKENLQSSWAGTLQLKFLVIGEIKPSMYQLLALNEFFAEALVNSFRHGRATSVDITIEREKSGVIHTFIEDDGVGYIPSDAGLGTAIFDEISQGNWSIESRKKAQGAIVQIKIPIKEKK